MTVPYPAMTDKRQRAGRGGKGGGYEEESVCANEEQGEQKKFEKQQMQRGKQLNKG